MIEAAEYLCAIQKDEIRMKEESLRLAGQHDDQYGEGEGKADDERCVGQRHLLL
jgi:hypothetical protein